MKAICIRQPWASMIASGQKTIETRTWQTSHRGDILLIASASPVLPGLPSGKSVAVVTLSDIRPMTQADEVSACCDLYDGAYSWLLTNIRLVPQIPVKGRLKLFDIDFPLK